MYRRICHFEVAVKDFLPSLGYLKQLLSLLKSITDMFPVNRNKLLIVKREVCQSTHNQCFRIILSVP